MLHIEKEHKRSTLMSMKKEELVKHIMFIEHNNNVLNERIEIQARNVEKLLRKEWIPCSEQSEPKENGKYLVSGRWLTSGNIKVGEAEYFGEWGVANNFIIEAWQPLPEPYKRGKLQ